MEDHSNDNALMCILRKCFGSTPLEKLELLQQQQQQLGASRKGGVNNNSNKAPVSSSSGGGGSNSAPSSQRSNEDRSNNMQNNTTSSSASLSPEASSSQSTAAALHGTFLLSCDCKLSQGAYVRFLKEFCVIVSTTLFDTLLYSSSVSFSEWGALLVYQEVSGGCFCICTINSNLTLTGCFMIFV